MNQLVGFMDIGFHDLLERHISCIFIPSPDIIPHLNFFYGDVPVLDRNQGTGDE